jgi:IMP dehydrogenase
MFKITEDTLVFDDVMLKPKYSNIKSRDDIDTSVKMGLFTFKHPLVPSPMKSLYSHEMFVEIIKSGGLAILHRFMSIDDQVKVAKNMISNFGPNNFSASIGIKDIDKENVAKFADVGVKIICIDIAHAHTPYCRDMVRWIKKKYPDMFIIAGNISTGEGARYLWESGVDAVRVGQGNGSICTTRVMTGNGVPQLSALIEVQKEQELLLEHEEINNIQSRRGYYIISDGGCKIPGDVVKSCCFADMIISGNLFAACDECEGNTIVVDGVAYKEYAGSSTHKPNHVEGVSGLVKCKGKYKNVLTKILEGLRSGCSYQGANNLQELKTNPIFVRITNAGFQESNAHDIKVVK